MVRHFLLDEALVECPSNATKGKVRRGHLLLWCQVLLSDLVSITLFFLFSR